MIPQETSCERPMAHRSRSAPHLLHAAAGEVAGEVAGEASAEVAAEASAEVAGEAAGEAVGAAVGEAVGELMAARLSRTPTSRPRPSGPRIVTLLH